MYYIVSPIITIGETKINKQMEKKNFVPAEMQVVMLDNIDIIATSGGCEFMDGFCPGEDTPVSPCEED